MINLSSLPNCAVRLNWNFTRLDDPGMTEYWAAVIVASFCDDEALDKFGGFSFEDRSIENGRHLLQRLEQCIRAKRHKVKFKAPNDLKALLGSRGVKTSELKTADDFWMVAEVLFPDFIQRHSDVDEIAIQIRKIDKKTRKKLADASLQNLPVEWVSNAKNNVGKLQ